MNRRARGWDRGLAQWWRRLAPLILAAAVLSAVVLAAGWPASGGRQAAPADATAAGAHPGGLASLSRLSVQGQSVISSTLAAGDPRFAPRPRAGGFGLTGGGTVATLGRDGVSVGGGGGRLSFGGLAVGRAGRLQPLATAAPQAHADRVTYARGAGVSEWYTAGPLGVEQGFTLSRRPAGRSGAATLALALAGSPARIAGHRVEFLARSGRVALRYGGLVASDARGRRLAARLSLSGSRLLVRVADRGARYPLRIDPFIQQGSKLTASDETGSGGFGSSVAVSGDGSTVLIGGPNDNGQAGAAWVFTRSGTTWTQQGPKLVGTGASGSAQQGQSVALSSDGNTALIGGPFDNNLVGAAWVFTRSGTTWTQQGSKLVGTGANAQSDSVEQGDSVALSGDGNTALVGGPNDDDVGAAWVFVRSGPAWTQQGSKLTASGESGAGGFGSSMALSSDGNTALIGGPNDNNDAGAAWVFARSRATWTQQGTKLVGSGAIGNASQGSSVALSSDGNTGLIGGPIDNSIAGAAWVFARSGTTWSQQGSKLTASDESGQSRFGWSVALAGDGGLALIGGMGDNSDAGAAWEFALSGSTWSQQGSKLVGTGEVGDGEQGFSVALSSDGSTAVAGAPGDNGNVGAAWAFAQPSYLYWDNPQVGPCPGNQACPSIGRGTIDGNPANVNQNFVTDIPESSHVGVAVGSQYIYWAGAFGPGAIGRANLDGSGVNQNFIPVGAISLAVDDHHIYWAGTLTDVATGGPTPYVGRANLDRSGVETQFIDVQGGALSVAVDSSHVYWTDPSGSRIGRANLDGTGVDPSFITGVVNPWGVAVDGQHIYWTQREGTGPPFGGSIGRANLDGSGVSPNFITGASEPEGVAVDYNHVYWANYYDCANNQTQSGCGTIGRANLDGSGVDQSFLAADSSLGSGCDLFDLERCGPSSVAVSAPTQPVCLRTSPTPAPPPGGAVFAQPLNSSSSDANVVVIPAGVSWTGPSSCTGIAQGSDAVMTHPASIAVAPDAAVLLRDQPAGLESAWGAQNAGTAGPAPVLFPGRSDWQTTEANMIAPQQLLDTYDGCPGCALPDNLQLSPGQTNSDVAYQHDLSGATLNGATLMGSFAGWDFSGARLPGAILNGTDVSGADFTGADLRGAHLTALVQTAPATFANVRVGALDGSCTTFTNSSLVGTGFTPVKSDLLVSGCKNSPLLPGSTAPLDLIHLLADTDQANVDFADAQFLATASNRDVLAGADLSGIDLAGARFVGFPPDFESTKFNGASLQKTVFQLADLASAQFLGAVAPGASFADANLNGASFAGTTTKLQNADFIQADVSGAIFQSADISNAVFNRALAVGTNFSSVIANNARFTGAHIYGDGRAFSGARQLSGADFVGAVLGGSEDGAGGFDLTGADLTNAKFDNAQCVACNFTGATLDGVSFTGADLPGAQLSGVTLPSASFFGTWLFCGDEDNDSCPTDSSFGGWDWPLALGSQESYGPVPFAATALNPGEWTDVTVCPDGTPPDPTAGCQGDLLPSGVLSIPEPCSAVALDACNTTTSTLFNTDTSLSASPISIVPAAPPTWATAVSGPGDDVGLTDATVRLVGGGGPPQVVAGSHNQRCSSSTQPCGDRGPASQALLGSPAGLAVGLDGSLYIADPTLHRVRRIDPSGTISTVAGSGLACSGANAGCGDGGPATAAALGGPQGVWVNPDGELFIADGARGIREVLANGNITTIGSTPGTSDVVSVTGDAGGNLYAATNNPDYILQINLASGQTSTVVGTGQSGYNGNQDSFGNLLPGPQVQINHPQGLSVALNGEVLFADSANHLIRAYAPSTGFVIDDLGGLVSNSGVPQGGFNGDGQYADQTEFENPAAVTATRGALLVVADTGNSRVRQIGPYPLPTEHGGGVGTPSPLPTPPQHPQSPQPPHNPQPPQLQNPPPPRPNNHFKVSHLTTHRNGTITLTAAVPGPGTIDLFATAPKSNRARAALRLHPAPGRFVFAQSRTTAHRAKTLHLRLAPNSRGRRLVRHHTHRVVLRLWVSYTPTGGEHRRRGFYGLRLPR